MLRRRRDHRRIMSERTAAPLREATDRACTVMSPTSAQLRASLFFSQNILLSTNR